MKFFSVEYIRLPNNNLPTTTFSKNDFRMGITVQKYSTHTHTTIQNIFKRDFVLIFVDEFILSSGIDKFLNAEFQLLLVDFLTKTNEYHFPTQAH